MQQIDDAKTFRQRFRVPVNPAFWLIEKEWWVSPDSQTLGVVIFDDHDKDWSFVVLRPKGDGTFCAVDMGINHRDVDAARTKLHEKMQVN